MLSRKPGRPIFARALTRFRLPWRWNGEPTVISYHYDGGPVGVETLAAALAEQRDVLEEVIEPYLIQQGLLQRTPRGRSRLLPPPEQASSMTQRTADVQKKIEKKLRRGKQRPFGSEPGRACRDSRSPSRCRKVRSRCSRAHLPLSAWSGCMN